MSSLLRQLPAASYRQLDVLFRHLRRIVAQQQANRMSADNLALVFGPTIMRSPDGLSGDMEVRQVIRNTALRQEGNHAASILLTANVLCYLWCYNACFLVPARCTPAISLSALSFTH